MLFSKSVILIGGHAENVGRRLRRTRISGNVEETMSHVYEKGFILGWHCTSCSRRLKVNSVRILIVVWLVTC